MMILLPWISYNIKIAVFWAKYNLNKIYTEIHLRQKQVVFTIKALHSQENETIDKQYVSKWCILLKL